MAKQTVVCMCGNLYTENDTSDHECMYMKFKESDTPEVSAHKAWQLINDLKIRIYNDMKKERLTEFQRTRLKRIILR